MCLTHHNSCPFNPGSHSYLLFINTNASFNSV